MADPTKITNARYKLAEIVTEVAKRIASRPSVTATFSVDEVIVGRYLSTVPEFHAALNRVIRARIEGRGVTPIPSNPEQALIDRARDYECRAIVAQIEALATAPPPDPFQPGAQE